MLENKGTSNGILMLDFQFVSARGDAAFAMPEPGARRTFAHPWHANFDSARVFGRLSIPYKDDRTGAASPKLRHGWRTRG